MGYESVEVRLIFMALDEIEINKSSINFKLWQTKPCKIDDIFQTIISIAEKFDINSEKAGFHDFDSNSKVIRGFFSVVVPFEVEHIVDGMLAKEIFKKVEYCEYLITPNLVFTTGKSSAEKLFIKHLTILLNYGIIPIQFEFEHLNRLSERLTQIKSIVVTNPKGSEVRKARLSGQIESYTEYNIIDPQNHNIEAVSGYVESPLGPINITVSNKGSLKISVKKGFILTLDCLKWLVALILDEKPPTIYNNSFSSYK